MIVVNYTNHSFVGSNIKGSFLKSLLLLEREKANCHCFYVETAYSIFKKRATNLILMRKIAITTLKSPFGF